MKIGIIGAGNVGSTLGRRWAEGGHDILYGVRNPADEKYESLRGHAKMVSTKEPATATTSSRCAYIEKQRKRQSMGSETN